MESGVSTGMSKPGKHVRCTDRRDMTIDVKNDIKPNSNQTKSIIAIKTFINRQKYFKLTFTINSLSLWINNQGLIVNQVSGH